MRIGDYWDAVLAQDADRLRPFFHEDARVNWHNTGERFTAEEFIRVNCAYPGAWEGRVERVERAGDLVITAVRVHAPDHSQSVHATSFIRVRDGRIACIDEYWGDDGPPPQWRLDMGIGTGIEGGEA